jgi:hypothetical protein
MKKAYIILISIVVIVVIAVLLSKYFAYKENDYYLHHFPSKNVICDTFSYYNLSSKEQSRHDNIIEKYMIVNNIVTQNKMFDYLNTFRDYFSNLTAEYNTSYALGDIVVYISLKGDVYFVFELITPVNGISQKQSISTTVNIAECNYVRDSEIPFANIIFYPVRAFGNNTEFSSFNQQMNFTWYDIYKPYNNYSNFTKESAITDARKYFSLLNNIKLVESIKNMSEFNKLDSSLQQEFNRISKQLATNTSYFETSYVFDLNNVCIKAEAQGLKCPVVTAYIEEGKNRYSNNENICIKILNMFGYVPSIIIIILILGILFVIVKKKITEKISVRESTMTVFVNSYNSFIKDPIQKLFKKRDNKPPR